MTELNRQWIYARPVTGELATENFAYREVPVPVPGQGQVLVRNRLVSLDPANRTYFVMQNYRPKLELGDVMASFAIGEVIESRDRRFKTGDLIHADLGWQDYAILNSYERSEYVYKCTQGHSDEDLIGVLGVTGLTAYFGLQEVGRLQAGETVVVGGATGACGAIIGQLAKLAGCRVIGFGGGSDKCQWLVNDLGFDAAIDYKGNDPAGDLARICPEGVDFFSDAVGGIVTQSTLPLMKQNARWYHYGNVSTYDQATTDSPVDLGEALNATLRNICAERNLRPRFLLVFDYYCQRKPAEKVLAGLLKSGQLKAPTTIVEGFDKLPQTLIHGTLQGNRYGKLNVRLRT
jgi:NADPH-dependent curcumin reductase CurA